MTDDGSSRADGPVKVDPAAARLVGAGVLALALAGGLAFVLLRRPSPPPAAIAGDPLLVRGREVFLERCQSCHGAGGKGDGPIAKGLSGPPVGDLTDTTWKHGDRPEEVQGVINKGVPTASMPGFGRTLGAEDVRSVTAYVYYLARREVPAELRKR
jgi:cytochrome c oxidase cbb3-type subunit 3